jgi:ATP-dependent Clp protease ATP-binding subunit ClpC
VLLGLLAQSEGLAAHVLADAGISRDAVVGRIEQIIGRGGERRWESLGVAPKVKRALEATQREARRLGHRCANTEHLLIGLCRSEDSVAVRILDDLGAPRETVIERVAEALHVDPVALRSPARRRRRLLTAHREG